MDKEQKKRIKDIAFEKGMTHIKENGMLKQDPMLALLVAIARTEGFIQGYEFCLDEMNIDNEEINKTFEQPKPIEQTPIISIHKIDDEVVGVRVCVGDEDFVIALKDAENPDDEDNEFEWAEACEKFNLPTVKQAYLIAAYLDEIQAKLVEAGGEKLSDNWYWTKSECSANDAWLYSGTYGYVNYSDKFSSPGVRPVLASNA